MGTKLFDVIRKNIGTALLVSVFVSSLLLNVKLGLELKRPAPHPTGVLAGSSVGTISAFTPSGNRVQLALADSRPTIVYILKPDCPWCARNIDNIRALAKQAGSEYRFIGLSNTRNGLAEYLTVLPLPFPVYAVDRGNLPKDFDVGPTPQTVFVRPGGIVEKSWPGALGEASQAEVEDLFHVKLPGLKKL